MKHVILASVLLVSLVLFGCVQQGVQKNPAVSVQAVGTPTPYVTPAPTAAPAEGIGTAESDQGADAAIEETENFDAAANASGADDVNASDLDRIQ